jgi:hypothetical protein
MWIDKRGLWYLAAASLVISGCSRPASQSGLRKMPPDQPYSGFLSTYKNLKENPKYETTMSYVSADPAKNVHKYLAVIVEAPVVYVATNVDERDIPDRGRAALADYFHYAVSEAVEDAFPMVQSPGPLVLRLRSAIVGVDVGAAGSGDSKDDKSLPRAINIGKVGVEMELVDSETGEQIAAAVDRQNLGEGTAVSSVNFSRDEKFRAATQAFDGWAKRLRDFLDTAHELEDDDVSRVEGSNFPFAQNVAK